MRFYLIALVVFVLDQYTKWLVKTNIALYEVIPVLGNFFSLTYILNRGAAFGILQGQQPFFLAVTIVFLAGIVFYLHRLMKQGKKMLPFALALMFGGAVGNFLDRLLYGEVVDFLLVTFKFNLFGWQVDYQYPIFNVADSGIVIGTLIILADSIITWRREAKQAAAKESTHDSV